MNTITTSLIVEFLRLSFAFNIFSLVAAESVISVMRILLNLFFPVLNRVVKSPASFAAYSRLYSSAVYLETPIETMYKSGIFSSLS